MASLGDFDPLITSSPFLRVCSAVDYVHGCARALKDDGWVDGT